MQYIERKSLINKSGVEWTDFNCNHYIGCAHNCQYPCYARVLSRKKQHEWTNVAVVENAMELAVKEIHNVPPGARIMVSSMTDPYQPIEATERLTRSLLPILAGFKTTCYPPRITIITKSDLVRRDFDLIKLFPNIQLCMTITSCDDIPKYEPYAPGNKTRIETLKLAHKMGIYTIASIEPWIPGVTKPLHVVNKLAPFVDEFFIGSWNHHYRRGSEAQKKMIRMYEIWLPVVVERIEAHMKRYVIKKEILNLIGMEWKKLVDQQWRGRK